MKLPNQSVVTLMGSGCTWLFVMYHLLFCAFSVHVRHLVYSMIQRFEATASRRIIPSRVKAVPQHVKSALLISHPRPVAAQFLLQPQLSIIMLKIYSYDGYCI